MASKGPLTKAQMLISMHYLRWRDHHQEAMNQHVVAFMLERMAQVTFRSYPRYHVFHYQRQYQAFFIPTITSFCTAKARLTP